MRLNDDWLVASELTNRILIGLPQTRHGTGPRWSLCSTDIERRRPRRMPRELLFRIDFARLRIGRQRLQVFIRDSFKHFFFGLEGSCWHPAESAINRFRFHSKTSSKDSLLLGPSHRWLVDCYFCSKMNLQRSFKDS